ncbi:MarR family winged helix-turn-helix transcriptional regulator [Streptomyces griseorubiginosus]|uniref:MarR family winged helix-turn-helix transcriptional regulator n=1 Tax=Streptomyces griseorubiginosus TaxID=67304 RepID=UPI00363759FA
MARATPGHAVTTSEVAGLTALHDSFANILSRWAAAGIQEVIIERAGAGIDPASMTVLNVLMRAGGSARPSHVAQQTGTGASNVSKVLARMEARGLVERATDEGDQRAVSITVTRAGRRTHQAVVDTSITMLGEVLHDWSHDDIELFGALLARYATALQNSVFG